MFQQPPLRPISSFFLPPPPTSELVKEAIYLLSNIAMTEAGCAAVQEAGAFDCLVEVVGQHIDSNEIREAAADLLKVSDRNHETACAVHYN